VASRLRNWNLGGFFRYSTEIRLDLAQLRRLARARRVQPRRHRLSVSYTGNFDSVNKIFAGRVLPHLDRRHQPAAGQLPLRRLHPRPHPPPARRRAARGHRRHRPAGQPLPQGPRRPPETHPLLRRRGAVSGFLRWAVPKTPLVLEPRYRFYGDDWGIVATASTSAPTSASSSASSSAAATATTPRVAPTSGPPTATTAPTSPTAPTTPR
jgi:hypothetical protein